MTQSAVKTACCFLLLLASIIQGLQDVPVFHYKTKEVLVGQNASLPCFIENVTYKIVIVSTEWTTKDTKPTKLALLAPGLENVYFVPNVTLTGIYNDADKLIGTHVELLNVDKGDAGTYICNIATYPSGTIRSETELRVKDKIECDMNSTIEVNSGENVTIHCSEFSNVLYTWSKGEVFVSDRASLQLLSVSGASSGLYTLKADTGNSRLEATFMIKVFTQTTDYWAEATSLSPSYTSNSGGSETTSHSPFSTFTVTENAPNSTTATIPASYRQSTKSQNTPVSTTTYKTGLTVQSEDNESSNHSETDHTNQNYNQSEGFDTDTSSYNHSGTTSIPSVRDISAEYAVTTDTASASKLPDDILSKTSMSNTSAPNTSQRSATVNTGATLTSSFRSTTDVPVQQDPSDSEGQSHLVLTLSIIGGLLLIVVALLLYRRRVVKKRMDLPPPFKPPPPPVKYAAVRNPQQQFPTDRCNSVTTGASAERRHMLV